MFSMLLWCDSLLLPCPETGMGWGQDIALKDNTPSDLLPSGRPCQPEFPAHPKTALSRGPSSHHRRL